MNGRFTSARSATSLSSTPWARVAGPVAVPAALDRLDANGNPDGGVRRSRRGTGASATNCLLTAHW